MVHNIKTSIIMPIYNSEKFLENALNSLIKQTLPYIEIICINDGSNDNYLAILESYAKKDSRIIIIINQNHQGAGAARNSGLARASGETIIFLDSDDFFEPDLIEKLYNKYVETDADITICEYRVINELSESICLSWQYKRLSDFKNTFSPEDISKYILNITSPYIWDKLYKTSFLKKYDLQFMNIPNSNDLYFSLMHLLLASKIAYIDDILISYRCSSNSLSKQRNFNNFNDIDVYDKLKEDMEKFQIYNKYEQTLINKELQSYSDALFLQNTFIDYIKTARAIKNHIPFYLPGYIHSKEHYIKFLFIKLLPVALHYWVYKFKK